MPDPTLHIITPVTRPETLPEIVESIANAGAPFLEHVMWWCVFDMTEEEFQSVDFPVKQTSRFRGMISVHRHYTADRVKGYGGPQRNYAIDRIKDGWITFIDDDSCVHPDYFRVIWRFLQKGIPKAFLYGQVFKNGGEKWFDLDDPCRHFEHSMLTIHRRLVGDVRQTAAYDCDKSFIRPIYNALSDEFVIIPRILAYYNWLRDDGWSWK